MGVFNLSALSPFKKQGKKQPSCTQNLSYLTHCFVRDSMHILFSEVAIKISKKAHPHLPRGDFERHKVNHIPSQTFTLIGPRRCATACRELKLRTTDRTVIPRQSYTFFPSHVIFTPAYASYDPENVKHTESLQP